MVKHKNKIFFTAFCIGLILILVFLSVFVGPIIVGFLFAYITHPVFKFIESKGLSKKFSVYLSFSLLVLLTIFACWVFVPIIFDQINSIFKRFPDFGHYMDNKIIPKFQEFIAIQTGQKFEKRYYFYQFLPLEFDKIPRNIAYNLRESGRFLFSVLIFVVMTPVFIFMFLKDLDKFYSFIFNLVPYDVRPVFLEFSKEVDKRLRAVLRGQVLVVILLTILYPLAFLVAGLPTAIAVGVLTGIARFIPYLDVITGVSLTFFVLVVNNASQDLVISVYLAFMIVQFLDIFFITPRIMGQFSGLAPFVVVLSVICFGYWLGFYGVLLAIPLTVIGKVGFKYMINSYRRTHFYTQTLNQQNTQDTHS